LSYGRSVFKLLITKWLKWFSSLITIHSSLLENAVFYSIFCKSTVNSTVNFTNYISKW